MKNSRVHIVRSSYSRGGNSASATFATVRIELLSATVGALIFAVLVGSALSTYGPGVACALVLIPLLTVLLLSYPTAIGWLALTVGLLVPSYLPLGNAVVTSWRLVIVATVALAIVATKPKPRLADGWALAVIVVPLVLHFMFSQDAVPIERTADLVTPVAFYALARLTVTEASSKVTLWVLFGVGCAGAASVLAELLAGSAIFAFGGPYDFVQVSGEALFRPAGVFQSPPNAAIALGMLALATSPLLVRHRRVVALGLLAMVTASAATFGRAGWAALLSGLLVLFIIHPPFRAAIRRNVLVLTTVTLGLGALVLFVDPPTSSTIELGVVRGTTVQSREALLSLALPLLADTPAHLLTGRGVGTFLAYVSGQSTPLDPGLARSPFLLERGGPHNGFVLILLEGGLVWVAAVGGWFMSIGITGARAVHRVRDDGRLAALLAALAGFLVAGLFHDTTSATPVYALAAFLAGSLVSLASASPRRSGVHEPGAGVTCTSPIAGPGGANSVSP